MDETVRAGPERLRAAHRRRRRARSRGHPARGDLRRPGPQADDRRRAHVQPVRPVGAARVRRGRRAAQVVVGSRAEHEGPARLRPPEPAQHPVAAPPRRRRLQRLVDVPDPDRRSSRSSASRCRSSSSGTTPSTGCGPATAAIPTVSMPGVAAGRRPGRTRTTPWTGRPTTTCATGSSPRCCTRRRTHGGAAGLGEPGAAAAEPAVHAVLDRRRCGCWRSRTCCRARRTCTPRSAPSWPAAGAPAAVHRRPGRGRPGELPAAAAEGRRRR